jgi:hypothetical protein
MAVLDAYEILEVELFDLPYLLLFDGSDMILVTASTVTFLAFVAVAARAYRRGAAGVAVGGRRRG